ncbi:DUF4064 domain-containing protein [Halobacillus locisalis]|uniref:DUF4064 domain-containing protein n=1 Tax=Halobacillus locisalis TaxID=220753 RepID=A0A838CXL6_9BACI|nr:DUF4064 domain-containing protein [Halobacillus locisalis]MBA2176671.1 DUF4064 domain-containing protein [Halobacillus locisalis]
MSRMIEIVLTIVGILLYALPLVVGFMFRSLNNNPQLREEFIAAMEQAPNAQELQNMNMDQMFNFMGTFATFLIIASVIAIALGVLAVVFLKGNKKPKAAGIILIVTAVVFTIATVFIGLFGSVAFLIAGIVALVRKTPKASDEIESV